MVAYLIVQDTMENEKYNTLRKRRKEILFLCNADSFPFVVSLFAKRNGAVKLNNWEGFAIYMLTVVDDQNTIDSSTNCRCFVNRLLLRFVAEA